MARKHNHTRPDRDVSQPLQWSGLTGEGKRAVAREHAGHVRGLVPSMEAEAYRLRNREATKTGRDGGSNTATATRLERMAGTVTRKTASLNQAAQNRVDVIKQGLSEARLPGESLPGANWYFSAGEAAVSEAPGYDPARAIAASSAMSPGTTPEMERRALGALAEAEDGGKVKIDGEWAAFNTLSPAQIGQVVKSRPEAEGVDYNRLGGPQSQNIGKAADILRGNQDAPQDPVKNPKTWSYTHDLKQAAEAVGTPVQGEYNRRAGVLGDRMRDSLDPENAQHFMQYKDKGGASRTAVQQSMDLYGLADSNEGILSDENHTAEDTWMQSITARHLVDGEVETTGRKSVKDRAVRYVKGLADVNMTAKGDVAPGDTSVSAAGVQHAFNNAATTQAARALQSEFQMDSTVPSVLVQETAWTAQRRLSAQAMNKPGATADREYNAALKDDAPASGGGRQRSFRGATKWGRG